MTWCLKPWTCANIFLSLWQRNGAAYHGDSRLDSRDLVPLKRGSGIKKDACFLPHPRHSLSSSEFQALTLSFFFFQLNSLGRRNPERMPWLRPGERKRGGVGGGGGWCLTVTHCSSEDGCKAISAAVNPRQMLSARSTANTEREPKFLPGKKKKVSGLLKLRPSGSKRVKCKHEPLDSARLS